MNHTARVLDQMRSDANTLRSLVLLQQKAAERINRMRKLRASERAMALGEIALRRSALLRAIETLEISISIEEDLLK